MRFVKFLGLFLALGFFNPVNAQDRYVVFLKYKPQTELTLARPQDFLTSKSINRRLREKIPADSLDLPIAGKYLQELKTRANDVLYSSKWLNALILVATENQVNSIKNLPFVEQVELAAKGFLPRPGSKLEESRLLSEIGKATHPKWNYRETEAQNNAYDFQNQLIGIEKMHEAGFTGKGITVAVFDAGFPGMKNASPFAHLFTNNQIIGQLDVVRPWNKEVFLDNQHGTNVTSLIASKEPGKLVAGAFDANYILAITEEVATEYRIEELNWIRAAEFADSLGVDIINSSLGYLDFDDPGMTYTKEKLDGKTSFITQGANIAAKKGILVVNSVGNYGARGTSSLTAPSDAFGILSVGSVTNTSVVSGFSSRGPTADGRIKPELVAFGQSPVLVRSNGTVGAGQGTSFSAPQIAALAAGLWQARPEWTKDQLILNLLRSATQYEKPDNNVGYGIPNFTAAYYGEILGVEDKEPVSWKMYPNPLNEGELAIDFGTQLQLIFRLIDSTGRLIIEQTLERSSALLSFSANLAFLRPGIYYVQVFDGNNLQQSKLIKR
jgi:subtilisin family serine protease